jgi:hypothetical protein
MGDRVRIGICTGPSDAAVVRAMLSAHGIESVVGGEHHANLLGGLGGALIALDITVAAEDGDEAFALLTEFRNGEMTTGDMPEGEEGEPEKGGESEAADDDADHTEPQPDDSAPDLRFDQRKRIGVALLLAACVTFGTAHMFVRAWGLGVLLAAIEIAALGLVINRHPAGGFVILGCVLFDAIGAVWRIRATARTNLPVARVR